MLLKIKELRKQKKLSQEVVAAKIDVSVRTYSDYEKETAEISVQNLQKIADYFQVHIFDLFSANKEYLKPEDEMHTFTDPNSVYEIQSQTIQFLKVQVNDLLSDKIILQKDKEFLQKVIEKGLNKAS